MSFVKYFNMNYNKGPNFGNDMVNVEEALKYWNFNGPKETIRQLVDAYGKPSSMSIYDATWEFISGINHVCVKDESIPHGDHDDYLYGCRQIAVPPDLYTPIAQSSPSIIIDAQRGVVISRCNKLAVVAIYLGFVEDVVSGKVKATPEELGKRVEEGIIPEWFDDKMGELLGESINEAKKEKNNARLNNNGNILKVLKKK